MTHSAQDYTDYLSCVADLLDNKAVQSMSTYKQHHGMSVLEHSLCVSYISFRLCKDAGLDYRSAARGGLLHDFFLYQRRINKPYKGWHTTNHPRLALRNAVELFELNDLEKEIIVKHMWPICKGVPKYRESFVVSTVDKYCSLTEFFRSIKSSKGNSIREQLVVQLSGVLAPA